MIFRCSVVFLFIIFATSEKCRNIKVVQVLHDFQNVIFYLLTVVYS